jgi:hypothetical protein
VGFTSDKGWGAVCWTGLVAVWSCGGTAPPPPVHPEPTPRLVALVQALPLQEAPGGAPSLASDPSLTVEEYRALGLPELKEPWTPEVYGAAAAVLVKLANDRRSALPRLKSKKSASVANKLTRESTFVESGTPGPGAPHAAAPLSPDKARAYLKSASKLMAVYAPDDETGAGFEAEQVELTLVGLSLLEPLVSDPDTPNATRQRLSGQVLAGALSMLGQGEKYPAGLRARLADGIVRRIHAFATPLGAELCAKAAARAGQLQLAEQHEPVRERLERIIDALRACSRVFPTAASSSSG